MRYLFRILPLLGVFLLSLMIHAQDVPTITVQISDSANIRQSGVNVRSTPFGRVYGVLYDGDSLIVTGRTDFDTDRPCTGSFVADRDMWLQVDLQGIEGWVLRCVVYFSGDMASVSIVEPVPAVPSEARICYSNCARDKLGTIPDSSFVIASARFNIRVHEFPSTQSVVLEVSSSPDIYVVGRTEDNNWVYVVQYAEVVDFRTCYYCPVEWFTQRGWVARFLVNLPTGWEDSIPIIE